MCLCGLRQALCSVHHCRPSCHYKFTHCHVSVRLESKSPPTTPSSTASGGPAHNAFTGGPPEAPSLALPVTSHLISHHNKHDWYWDSSSRLAGFSLGAD